ncbi:hypothetical protein COO91_03532 [Nostoc flagelliforme CCNUN1]|uniref:Uncharacterized protein n=1 Tax=Nostoc flagelliforme CCNUN1 TaxID=2038116 RepID=A0A2K8SQ44_9NOSO|nr:hypothetical protein COO91_03532 [Nostoc flagelliforme CCNUN1]
MKAVLNLRYHQTYFFSDRKLCVEAKNGEHPISAKILPEV